MPISFISRIKTKIGATISATLSAVGASGTTTSTICQTTCTVSSGIVPLLGTSLLAVAPLAFLFRHQIIIWWITFIFVMILTVVYVKSKLRSKIDLILILVNSMLLGFSMPYFKENQSRIFIAGVVLEIIVIVIFILPNLNLIKRTKKYKIV